MEKNQTTIGQKLFENQLETSKKILSSFQVHVIKLSGLLPDCAEKIVINTPWTIKLTSKKKNVQVIKAGNTNHLTKG